VAAAYLITRQELYHPDRAQIPPHEATEALHVGVVEECTAVDVDLQLQVLEPVVTRELHAVLAG
jgi:hypothetical protein